MGGRWCWLLFHTVPSTWLSFLQLFSSSLWSFLCLLHQMCFSHILISIGMPIVYFRLFEFIINLPKAMWYAFFEQPNLHKLHSLNEVQVLSLALLALLPLCQPSSSDLAPTELTSSLFCEFLCAFAQCLPWSLPASNQKALLEFSNPNKYLRKV